MNKLTILTIFIALTVFSSQQQSDAQSVSIGESIGRTAQFEAELIYQKDVNGFESDEFMNWQSKWLKKQSISAHQSTVTAMVDAQVAATFGAIYSWVVGRQSYANGELMNINADLYYAQAYGRLARNLESDVYHEMSMIFHRSALSKIKAALRDAHRTREVSSVLRQIAGFEHLGQLTTIHFFQLAQTHARVGHHSTCNAYNDVRLLAKVIAANPDFDSHETQNIDTYPMSFGN